MTLDQLRIFVAVAERQHVTRAAEALHLVPSAVSSAIRALESRHDTALFDRVGRGIALTAAGRVLLEEARAVLARADEAERALADLAGLARGTLAVQASQTIAGYWLPRHLVAFRARHPGVTVRLGIGNTAGVAESVKAGTAELGFVEGEVDDPALETAPLARDTLVLAVASGHSWAGRDTLDPADLAGAAWVLRESGSGTRAALEAALAARGVPPAALRVAFELPSNEAVRAAVEAGAGPTILSASVAAPGLEAGLLATVPFALPARTYAVVTHRERRGSRAARALVGLIRDGQGSGRP